MKKKVISLLTILLIGIIIFSITNIGSTKALSSTLADIVITKWQENGSPTSWNSGASGIYYTNSHEYRYIGANVDNWLEFNNDLYRIIGVFDSNSTGVSGNLVKLIRAKELMAVAWGVYNSVSSDYTTYSNYVNDWTGSVTGVPASANVLLNEFFLNPTATSTYGSCANWTYYRNSNQYKTMDCSKINRYGIQVSNFRNYIQPVTWYLKGFVNSSYFKLDFYNCERGLTTGNSTKDGGCFSGYTGTADTTTSAKIGLMYVSDYLYASGYYASTSTAYGYERYYGQQNWLYNGNEWTITPVGNDNVNAFYVANEGGVGYINYTFQAHGLRPVFYLKEQVYVTGGDGSFHNPYTIACDTCNE